MAKDKGNKGRKIGRNKRHQALAYKAGARYEINRKRRWRRVLREQPGNMQLRARYEKEIGPYEGTPCARVGKAEAAKRRSVLNKEQRRAEAQTVQATLA